ncbi:MAG: hypothetical protein JOZ75_08925 [Candidatus Dormibacteraeota bacterium]|nr:hypothetical protein [Candidatus Dormibacteraeota bacterium]
MNIGGQTVTTVIKDTIAVDQNVFDNTSTKVGVIDTIDYATGWLTIAAGPLESRELYVPFRLITFIDPHELFLGASKDELTREYSSPPQRTTAVTGKGAGAAATTTEPSGYDGAPVLVNAATVATVRDKIASGFEVYTSDMSFLGTIKEYDPTTGLMMLQKGPLSDHELVVPISVVNEVDTSEAQVVLTASEADVKKMTPVSVVRTAAQLAGN